MSERTSYWIECLQSAFDEHGIAATDEQIKLVAEDVEGAHENIGMAFYVPESPQAPGWREISEHPPTDGEDSKAAWGDHVPALLYSPQLGVVSGTVHRLHGGKPYASVSSFHGDAVEFWGVTHYQPLPSPPAEGGE